MSQSNPYEVTDITVNVPTSEGEKERLLAQERTWKAPRFVALAAVTLIAAFALLYTMSSTTAEVSYPNWWLP